jgi:hypothetical protein
MVVPLIISVWNIVPNKRTLPFQSGVVGQMIANARNAAVASLSL